ncbi:MAG: bifunctional aminodeoxychorismate synthase component I/aminotransferase, partial [Pyrinomonadaceae bacterium]
MPSVPSAVFGSSRIVDSGWLIRFDEPIRTLWAQDAVQVRSLLESAEVEARNGFWVALMLSYEAAPAFDRALKTRVLDSFPLAWSAVFAKP